MGLQVVNGATLTCSMGTLPSNFIVLPVNRVSAGGQSAANIMDYKPLVNIMPFGPCNSLTFPATASATAAASGVLTPMPCVPLVVAPWTPGSPTVLIGNFPALNNSSQCLCTWGGIITITSPGQMTVNIP